MLRIQAAIVDCGYISEPGGPFLIVPFSSLTMRHEPLAQGRCLPCIASTANSGRYRIGHILGNLGPAGADRVLREHRWHPSWCGLKRLRPAA